MNSVYLYRDDLMSILQFMDAFPDAKQVEITHDHSSGIGVLIDAHIHGVDLNGMVVKVTKTIADESCW